MSVDGSESKPTVSNLDFSEARRKSRNEIPKLDDKSEVLAMRSFTQSPFLNDRKLNELIFDEPQDFTPKSFSRFSKKNKQNLNKGIDVLKLRNSVGEKNISQLPSTFENMI
jgi:hypothetical protein